MEFEIGKCAKLTMKKWKRETTGNKTTKSEKHENIWRKGKLHVPGNTGSGHHQTKRDERKDKNRIPQKNKKFSRNQTQELKSSRNKYLGSAPCKILWIILKMRKEYRQTVQRTAKLMTIYKALHLRHDIDYMCQKKKEKED